MAELDVNSGKYEPRDPEREIAILRRALEWYADPKHYDEDTWGVASIIQPPDYGKPGAKARAALKRAGLS